MENGKLIIEAFIAYMLSAGLDCTCFEIFDIMEKVDGKASLQSAKERRLRRYIEDFQNIGALVSDTRISNLSNGMNGIPLKDYSLNLIDYSAVRGSLKPLYRVVKILNSECGEDPKNDQTIAKFKEKYFSNGLEYSEDSKNEMMGSLNIIMDMINVYEPESQIIRQKYDNVFSILADIKINHGYDVR